MIERVTQAVDAVTIRLFIIHQYRHVIKRIMCAILMLFQLLNVSDLSTSA